MLDREELEKRAKELELEFAADMSDADLAALIEKAEARADLEARATALGVTFGATIGDKRLKARVAEAEAKRDGGEKSKLRENNEPSNGEGDAGGSGHAEDDGETITVICAVGKGRRRAGRAWSGGANHIAAAEFTDEMAEALEADPMFQVKRPVALAAD